MYLSLQSPVKDITGDLTKINTAFWGLTMYSRQFLISERNLPPPQHF